MKQNYIVLFITFIISTTYGQSVISLEIGNKWFYNVLAYYNPPPNYNEDTVRYVKTFEVLKDTTVNTSNYGYVQCYKVKIISNTNYPGLDGPIDYEYWNADSIRFYNYFGLYPFEFEDVQYDEQIERDTCWEWTPPRSLFRECIDLSEISFLNIQDRKAQQTEMFETHSGLSNRTIKMFALNFGFVNIEYEQVFMGEIWSNVRSTVKGAIINGITYGDTSLIVSIGSVKNPIANEFKLEQNYPNPFNPTTNIKFEIPKTTNVSITVFDILGRNIVTLLDEEKAPGEYTIPFDASNFSSSIYFYVFRTNNFIQTRKMILIK